MVLFDNTNKVQDQCVAEGSIIPAGQFTSSEASIYYKPRWWTPPTPSSVMSWALTKTGLYSNTWKSAGATPGSLKNEQYVVVAILETTAKALLEAVRKHQDSSHNFAGSGGAGSYTQTVYTRELFYKLFQEFTATNNHQGSSTIKISSLDLDILLIYLSRDLPRVSVKDDTIKINLNATSYADIVPVSEQDRAVANLRQTVHDVVKRIDGLSARIETCDKSAKEALAGGKSNAKIMAKYAIRSRKLAQTTQETSLDMLANLEQTLLSIDNASSTVDIMASLRKGVNILSSLNQAVGGAEKVAELVDELHDTQADTDEIGREISSLAGSVDEADLDEELEQMLAEEKAKEKAAEKPKTEDTKEELSVEDQLKTAPEPPHTIPEAKVDTEADDLANQLSQVHIG